MQTLRIVGKASHVKFINSLWRIVPYSCVDASNNNNSYYTDDCFLSKSGGEGDKREGEKKRKEKRRKEKEANRSSNFSKVPIRIRTSRVEKMIRVSISPIET